MTFGDRPEWRLAIALAIGLLVGAEREQRKGEGPSRKAAGVRTFALVGLLGGLAGLAGGAALVVAGAVLVGAAALVAYGIGDREDPGLTTEVALVITYVLGVVALSMPALAFAGGVTATLLLAARTHLHHLVRNVVSEAELLDAVSFAFAAIVVLPLVPDRAVDPFGVVNPFRIWRLAVVMMGITATGYVAQRVLGTRFGMALAGFASGFVSSSATIAAMGARAKKRPEITVAAISGAATSTIATYAELAVLVGAASTSLLVDLAWPLGAGGVAALLYGIVQAARAARSAPSERERGSAFSTRSALVFAALVSAVSFVAGVVGTRFGSAALVAAAAIAGFADAHATSASIASVHAEGRLATSPAVLAVLLTLATNTTTKAALAWATGPRRYAVHVTTGLAITIAATAVGAIAWAAFR